MAEKRKEMLLKSREDSLKELISLGIEPYSYSFDKNHSSVQAKKLSEKLKENEKSKEKLSVAGRIILKRNFGKLFFFDLLDGFGKIQVLASLDSVGKENFKILELLDVGDFIGVQGNPYKTKKGEPSVFASKLTFLTKAHIPLPDKWHGLKDIEARYRKRYLDLIANSKVREIFFKRSKIISFVKKFLEEKEFLETDIPLLQPNYGGANARPFITESHAWKSNFYLSISPELYLKRLIVGGFEKVYTICKNFRNEGVDKTHNPEFTMMECYAAYWDYNDVMKLTEELFEFVVKELTGKTKITYQDKEIDFKTPWKKITVYDALKKYADLDVEKLSDSDLKKLLKENQLELDTFKRGLAIAELFDHFCEEKLIQPTFVIDYPKETTPLCKPKRGNKDLIERFELFINGWEFANAYSELNNPELQEKFFKEQADQGRAKGENHPVDEDYVEALKYGMPPAGGLGIGIDRVVMLLTNSATIKDVILFPQMKPEEKKSKPKKKKN